MRINTYNMTVLLPRYGGKRHFNNISRTAVKRYEMMYADEWPKAAFILDKVAAKSQGSNKSWLSVTA